MIPARITPLGTHQLQILAPAKLNLGLRVFPLRPDKFHPLETWMVPLAWHDTLTVIDDPASHHELTLKITGREESIPTEIEKNLVGRAALKLAAKGGIEPRGTITLHKVVPPGGGMGGGSSDAANVLVALNELWGLRLPVEELIDIAATLGSDIPFFVPGIPALCTGRGEIMTKLFGDKPLHAVLILPPGGCPTKDVYQAFDAGHVHGESIQSQPTKWSELATLAAEGILKTIINDLEPPAFFVAPWLKQLSDRCADLVNRRVVMTGSGSTLFTLFDAADEAAAIATMLQKILPADHNIVATQVLTGA